MNFDFIVAGAWSKRLPIGGNPTTNQYLITAVLTKAPNVGLSIYAGESTILIIEAV
ncbi:hypothetical protein ACO2Q8_21465 [Larkinella sp. VNQ87]|uniref:hypothetical protein n=1 Tax=Larkinella sp. VNQ87 TaxID=3400921 RepID=UPI003BFB5D3C